MYMKCVSLERLKPVKCVQTTTIHESKSFFANEVSWKSMCKKIEGGVQKCDALPVVAFDSYDARYLFKVVCHLFILLKKTSSLA